MLSDHFDNSRRINDILKNQFKLLWPILSCCRAAADATVDSPEILAILDRPDVAAAVGELPRGGRGAALEYGGNCAPFGGYPH